MFNPLPPDARNAWVTNDDVGAVTAAALRTPASRGRWLRLAGPEILTLPDVAVRLGRALGRDVEFTSLEDWARRQSWPA